MHILVRDSTNCKLFAWYGHIFWFLFCLFFFCYIPYLHRVNLLGTMSNICSIKIHFEAINYLYIVQTSNKNYIQNNPPPQIAVFSILSCYSPQSAAIYFNFSQQENLDYVWDQNVNTW